LLRYLPYALIALLLAGCTSLTDLKSDISERMFGAEPVDPPVALKEFKSTATARIVWHASVGAADTYDFTPAQDGTAIFAASADGTIVRLDTATGKQIWKIAAGEKLSGGVGAGENLVLVGTPKGMVLAFDQNGKALWKSKVSSEVLSAPKISNGIVVVRSGDSRIFGIDPVDGKRKWVYERAIPTLALRSSAGVALDGGIAYAGFAGGKLIALKADDGKLLWETSVAQPKGATEIERIADITSLPVVDGRVVYAVAFQGKIAAIDRASGKVMWNRDISSYTGMSSEGVRVYVTHSGGAVYAMDYTNGKSYWRQGGLLNRQVTAPLPVGADIAVGDLEGYLHFLSHDDGSFVARIKTDSSPVMAQMLDIGNATVLLQTRNGGLYAVTVK
jgi:outer membrane protein assembly factor BamB